MFDTRLRLLVRLSDLGQAECQLIVYYTRDRLHLLRRSTRSRRMLVLIPHVYTSPIESAL